MKKAHPFLCGAVLLAAGFASTLAAVEPATAPTATAIAVETGPAPLDPYARDLLNALNSTDPAKREAAKKQLASIVALMQSPEVVTHLRDTTTDQELKDFYDQRLVQLKGREEERRLANMPPLSLNVSNASLADVVAALNKALDAPIKFEAGNTSGLRVRTPTGIEAAVGPVWTLDVKDKPLWEVFTALQEQQPLEIQNAGNQMLRLSAGGMRGQRYFSISGPVIAFATGINYQRSVSYPTATGGARPANLSVQLMMVIDPRIRTTRLQMPTAVKATDDEGRNLASPNQGGGFQNIQTNIFNWSLALSPPERLAKTVTVSYDSAITTTVGDTIVALADIQKNLNKPVTFAGRTARITSLSGETQLNGQLSVQRVGPVADTAGNTSVPFTISDATGRSLYASTISTGTTGISFQTQNSQPPYKLEFRIPGRNVDLPIHMELKDLPLP